LIEGFQKRGLAFIAEYKRASPSLGDINLEITPEAAAGYYTEADCISVLTEERYFKGDINYLQPLAVNGSPLLRKDFIFDPLQVMETTETPASAILLMARLLPDRGLIKDLKEGAEYHGLEPVVEVFDLRELELARSVAAKLIQFNARDLNNLKVDPDQILKLAALEPPEEDEIYIAASGLKTSEDLIRASERGFKAALIGTRLMSAQDPAKALAELMAGFKRLAGVNNP
jgi:indole-3-glycerol phosphate synthase